MVRLSGRKKERRGGSAPPSDEDLVLRIRRNEPGSFRLLVDRHGDGIYRFCHFMVDNHEVAEDITQETFLIFLRVCRGTTAVRSAKSYLVTVARRRCLNYIRDRKSRVPIDGGTTPSSSFDVGDIDRKDELHRALQGIPDHFREAFLLYELEGFSYEEIAEALEITYGAVKNRIYRAKQELRQKLAPLLRDGLD